MRLTWIGFEVFDMQAVWMRGQWLKATVAWLPVAILCLLGFGGNALAADDFLPPEQAFKVTVSALDPSCSQNCLMDVRIEVAQGYYLYRERFRLEPAAGVQELAFVDLPRGDQKFDEFLKENIEALRGELNLQLRYSMATAGLPSGQTPQSLGKLISQGCADAGLCYPPQPTELTLASGGLLGKALGSGKQALGAWLGGSAASTAAEPGSDGQSAMARSSPSNVGPVNPTNEADSLAQRLSGQSAAVVLPIFFGLGLLLAFTPCTLPMLPIVSSLVVGQQVGRGASTSAGKVKPLLLALMYVVGMASTYAVLGVVAGLSGQSLVVALQQPPVLWSFSAVLAGLGVALLLGYSLQLPSGLQGWIQEKTGRLQGGQFVPVLVMGMLSALLLGPCVAPPLAGALLYIGQSGNALLGGAALFVLALGMGLPLVLFAAGAGTVLPKAGQWMSWVSAAFGFILLALAVWTATPVTPVPVVMALWAVLGALVAAALWSGVERAQSMSLTAMALGRAFALLSAISASAYAVGLFSGSQSLLTPLAGVGLGGQRTVTASSQPAGGAVHSLFERVDSANALATIAQSKQPVMLDFYADWCVSCKEFELFTLVDPTVQQRLSGVRLLQVDVTANTPADQALMKQFKLFGPPAILFFPAGAQSDAFRVIGFQNAEKFAATLSTVRPLVGLQ
ncbi:protein-disulfide reductase DsbD [Limnobacter humi]|uniref:Protein-disulfide reductase DsbD n=1 Tax=Limnobacter humi TaxID=1778671 RepID=A0ABT1WCU7_9BURK|nr:protein-disulfide reductase DsbD [Limnobacter humi]MCQ8895325.1 protein-disulfide reductase DsbD [Limnobacter humi]